MLAEFSILPIGEGASFSDQLVKIFKLIDESGMEYKVNPMGTVIEGEMKDVFDLIQKCHETLMQDVSRVMIHLTIDDRKDRPMPRIERKIKSLEEKVGKTLKR